MEIIDNIPIWGEPDPGALVQIKNCAKFADKVALMADNHKGYGVPIGGVLGIKDGVSPTGVGYDIGCGNKAVQTALRYNDKWDIEPTLAALYNNILSFGVGRKNKEKVDHPLFDDGAWQLPHLKALRDKAASQLGTIGSGNHYVDILVDENNFIWIGVHFGSRGLGHSIATHYMKLAGAKDYMDADPVILDTREDIGKEYILSMQLAGQYAYAGRDWVCQRVADFFAADIEDEIHNHHNYAWLEDGMWIIRKGATPAYPGQRGFVGGSMGDYSVILEGIPHEDSDLAMNSTVHGAGRVMSRTRAAGKSRWKHGKKTWISDGEISPGMMGDWLERENVILKGGGLDEAPQAYRRLPTVLEAHSGTINILHWLKPVGVMMAGEDTYDPWKD